jgi:hypothetical protein
MKAAEVVLAEPITYTTLYMTVYMAISLPEMPYIYIIYIQYTPYIMYMILANPSYFAM